MSDASVGGIKGTMELDLAQWDARVAQIKADVVEMKGLNADVRVTASVTEAEQQLALVDAAATKIDSKSPTVRVKSEGADSVAAAEAKVTAAVTASDTATARAQIAEMRLQELRDKGARSASQLAAAELALSVAVQRSESSAAKAAAAEDALAAAQQAAAASAVEEAAAQDAVAESTAASNDSMFSAVAQNKAMVAGIAALVAAAGPLSATVVGLGGGLAGMGAAGVLAIVGVKNEMAQGTQVGQEYSAGLSALKGDLNSLGDTAATAMLSSFQDAERQITADLPNLNSEVGQFASILGQSGDTLLQGVISGLKVANPLFVEGADFVQHLAAEFRDWTQDGGLQSFVTYAEGEMPKVENAIENTAKAAIELTTDLAPVGETMIDIVNDASQLISVLNTWQGVIDKVTSSGGGFTGFLGDAVNSAENALNPIRGLSQVFPGLQTQIDKWTGANKTSTSASIAATQAAADQQSAVQRLAAQYGWSTSAYQAAKKAADDQTQSTKAATQAMQLENDAAGLLTATLDGMNGKTLNVAEAQTAFAGANNSLTASFKTNGTAIDGNSAKAVANQQAIQQAVSAAEALAEATTKSTGSTQAGTKSLEDSKAALEAGATPAVKAYIDKLLDLSSLKVPPTQIQMDTGAANKALRDLDIAIAGVPKGHVTNLSAEKDAATAAIAALKSDLKTVPANQRTTLEAEIASAERNLGVLSAKLAAIPRLISISAAVHANTSGLPTDASLAAQIGNHAHGGTIAQHFATGGTSGTVSGSVGSATSDSVVTALSLGEEVTQSYAAGYPGVRPVLKALNADPKGTMQALFQRPVVAAPSIQPIYMDGGALFGWIRTIANGEARLEISKAGAEAYMATMGGSTL